MVAATRKLGFMLVAFVVCVPAFAAGSGAISGYVKSDSGTPQMGAVVEIFTSAAKMGAIAYTDGRGFYSIRNLTPGLYQVKVTAASFLPSLRENVSLRDGAHVVVNLTLTTLDAAIKLLPPRRTGNEDTDDWRWTLRSASSRPVLRVTDDGPPLVMVSNSETADNQRTKAQVAFIAGAGGEGFGSSGDMTTAFALETSVFSTGKLSLDGNINSDTASPSGVLRATYARDFSSTVRPKFAVTYRHLANPGTALQGAAYSAISLTSSDTMSIGDFVEAEYGADLQEVDYARRITAFRPFASVYVHLSPNTLVEYRYATSEPNTRAAKGFDTAPADLTESGPRMTLAGGRPELERARHQEVALARRLGNTSIEVAYYADNIRDLVLTGAGDPAGFSDDALPDVYSATFSYPFAMGLDTSGARVVVQRKLSDDFNLALDYANGGAVTAVNTANQLSAVPFLRIARQQSVGLKGSGKLPVTRTRVIASYKWTSGNTLSSVDSFNVSPGQMDPYFSLFLRQPLPCSFFRPGKMEALVDVRNLLAQGYIPVFAQDGHTLYLVQAARSVRGGLAFTF
ncbi:MAG TPA: carboxypeptidase-like regulatory domain-containing protein [Alphaproteobacteria bacterium]|nr:carboxypeptidase-like regulatory domain-containing protein [Alphaproteobacteria bacterium]